MMKMDYETSVKLALALGFERVIDSDAYNGEYFIKDNKKWIHWIERLKAKLDIINEKELEEQGYDLDSYYEYRVYTNEMAIEKIQYIKLGLEDAISGRTESVLNGRYDIYDEDNLKTLTQLKAEGLDDEILYDYLHQKSKR